MRVLTLISLAAGAFFLAGTAEPDLVTGPVTSGIKPEGWPDSTLVRVGIPPRAADEPHHSNSPPAGHRDFHGAVVDTLGGVEGNLFDVFKDGFDSRDAEKEYLAHLAHDACLSYVRPTSTPLEKPFPDGDSMRRAQAIRAKMKLRCEGFGTVRIEDFIRMGRELQERTSSGDGMLSTNYASMPRSPTAEDIQRVRERLTEVLLRYGPVALLSNTGNLVDWLVEARRVLPDVQIHGSLQETDTLNAAVSIAICHAGFDCSADSTLYGITCGAHLDCAPSVEESLLASVGDKRAVVLAQARVIGQAFLQRDPGPLGLIGR